MRALPLTVLLIACGADTRPTLELEEPEAPVEVPELDPRPPAEVTEVSPPDLVDGACASPREARIEPAASGLADGDRVTEWLDANDCVAVRIRVRVEGRTTTTITEVPGEPRWFPQPPSYMDLTPRPLTEIRTVDARGRDVERRVDQGSDGTFEQVERYVWEGEHLVERAFSGEHDWTQRWTYDADGQVIRETSVTPDHERMTERTFDDQGRKRTERMYADGLLVGNHTWEYDGDRLVEHRNETPERMESTVYVYRADGTLARREWSRTRQGTALIVEHHDFSRDADGNEVEHYRRDDRGDGVIDAQRWTTRDAEGREILVRHDRTGDGQVGWEREQAWDDQGRMVFWENREYGQRKLLRTWTYEGDELVEQTSFPAPGRSGTWIERRAIEYGAVVVRTFIDDGGETLLSVSRTRFHTPEIIATQTVDRDGDGQIDERLEQQVDREDRVVGWTRTTVDGVVWRSHTYDHTGQMAETRGNWAPDGPETLISQTLRDRAGNTVFELSHQPGFESPFRVAVDYLE